MKEKIYTIPVTDAFRTECECPLCVLEKQQEEHYLDYFLGPSVMEPESRIETNERGFCRRHIEIMYNKQQNRLPLSMLVDTHIREQNNRFVKAYKNKDCLTKKFKTLKKFSFRDCFLLGNVFKKNTATRAFLSELASFLSVQESECSVCHRLNRTMKRYLEITLYLWFKEEDFRQLFRIKKGFCLKHFRQLLETALKHLNEKRLTLFTDVLIPMQIENMDRIQKEVNWFGQKFAYHNKDAPWGNSKDALIRSIQKVVGYCDLK